jgi:hypothetical protein
MSQKCVQIYCPRLSRAVCKCCNKDLCLQHFWQHSDLSATQLKILKKEINEVDSRYRSLNLSKSSGNFRHQLKEWRIDCYTTIDRYYEQKCQEFNRYIRENVENQRDNIDRLQKRVDEFIDTEYASQYDIDLVKTHVNNLNDKIEKFERTPVPIVIQPLVLDEHLIQIKY